MVRAKHDFESRSDEHKNECGIKEADISKKFKENFGYPYARVKFHKSPVSDTGMGQLSVNESTWNAEHIILETAVLCDIKIADDGKYLVFGDDLMAGTIEQWWNFLCLFDGINETA